MTDITLADSPARLSRADWLASLPRNTACSALVLHDAEYRLLLVHATYEDSWQFVGGVRDAQDDPWTTAVREAREEIGYELVGPPRLLGYDWVTFEDSGKPSSTSSAPPSWSRSGWTASASRRSTTTGSCSRSRSGPGTSARTAPGGSARSATRCAPAVPSACATATR